MFQTKVEAVQREGSSVIEMETILHTVYTSTAERLASRFVTTLNHTFYGNDVGRWL
jgi:hypothetical protein